MKRIFIFFPLLVCSLHVNAQELFVRFSRSLEIDSARFEFLEGEILPMNSDDNSILLWEDTVYLTADPEGYNPHAVEKDYRQRKNDFVKLTSGGMVHVDVSSLGPLMDTVFFVCEDQAVIPLFKKTSTHQDLSTCGQKFRLIIPGTPTIFYAAGELSRVAAQVKKTEPSEADHPAGLTVFSLIGRYKFESGILVIALVAAMVFIVSRRKIRKISLKKNDNGKGSRASGIHRDFTGENDGAVKISNKPDWIHRGQEGTGGRNEDDPPAAMPYSKNIEETQQFLHGMESRILQRIESIQSDQALIRKLNENLDQADREKNELKQALEKTRGEKQKLQGELDLLNNRVISVDFLKNYCEAVSGCLMLCREIIKTAYGNYKNQINDNPESAETLGKLLLKFEYKKPLHVGKWEQIVLDIRDSGTTPNLELIRSFRQVGGEEDRVREFKRQLFDMMTEYISLVLILAEELKNFSRFTADRSTYNAEMETRFSGMLNDLLNKIRTTKLEARYVPLFVNNAKYSNFIKVVNQRPSGVYSTVFNTLNKNSVAEIVSYGFTSEFGSTDTQIILA
ncbi:MAG: hypothetical protein KFF73_12405 [Cyclobacteriaceae bacterium]|nr:hypothetical protein [Cyclobacteriaceae bacterium]